MDLRYTQKVNLKKGEESFRNEYEFVEELLEGE